MDKLASIAKKLDVLAKIFFWFFLLAGIIGGLVMGGAVVYYALNPDSVSVLETLSLGFVELKLADDYLSNLSGGWLQYAITAASLLIGLPFSIWWIKCIRNILKPLKEKEPFSGIISINLKKLGWLTVIIEVIDNIVYFALCLIENRTYHLSELLLSDKITSVTTNYTFDLSFVVTCAVLFLLSYIFRYGEQLQQLSDETL